MTKFFDVHFSFVPHPASSFAPNQFNTKTHRSVIFNVARIHKLGFGQDISAGELMVTESTEATSLQQNVKFGEISTNCNGIGGELLTWPSLSSPPTSKDYTPIDPNNTYASWKLQAFWHEAKHYSLRFNFAPKSYG
jgi:hypothetical protein